MSESESGFVPEGKIDLNGLRDQVKAGKDSKFDFSGLSPEEVKRRLNEGHIMTPGDHPELGSIKGPSIDALREILAEKSEDAESPTSEPDVNSAD